MTHTRRHLLARATAGAGAALLLPEGSRTRLWAAVDSIVETASGKVRGRNTAGIHSFLGVRYGASTEGRNRFMPPQKPRPWTGIQDAFAYGNSAPQTNPARRDPAAGMSPEIAQLFASGEGPQPAESEDCLFLNVWTPGINGNRKRATMLFHNESKVINDPRGEERKIMDRILNPS